MVAGLSSDPPLYNYTRPQFVYKKSSSTIAAGSFAKGKVAVIIGGTSEIGEAVARFFAAEGASVVIADIHDTLGDVREELHVTAVVALAVNNYGHINIMLSNADIVGSMTNVLDHEKFVKIGLTFLLEEANPPPRWWSAVEGRKFCRR